jgi:hypothetical protein
MARVHLGGVLHASEDPQAVRDEVFRTLQECDMRIDATVVAKSAVPRRSGLLHLGNPASLGAQ